MSESLRHAGHPRAERPRLVTRPVAQVFAATFTSLPGVFLPLVVVAALLYTRAETRFADDPARARALVNWSWLCVTAPIVIAAVAAALLALKG